MSVIAFTTVGNHQWVVPAGVLAVRVLVVAGGGGGGGYAYAGGGGAGGALYESIKLVSGTIDITVGAAGLGGANSLQGGDGGNSSFDDIIAIGGGGGGSYLPAGVQLGRNGGCGGGSSRYANSLTAIGLGSQGFDGGAGLVLTRNPGGGGGGMGSTGINGAANKGGNGGAGVYYGDIFGEIYGASGWFAGGGGGGIESGGVVGYGQAGGGNGAIWSALAKAAQANTGSGGGGGTANTTTRQSNTGGSGIVLIKAATTLEIIASLSDEELNTILNVLFFYYETIKFDDNIIVLDNSLTGYAIPQPTALERYITASNIEWTETTPVGTTINVYTGISNDSETLPDIWVAQTSGTPINSVPTYENLGGKYLWVKYELESDDLAYSPNISYPTITFTYGEVTVPALSIIGTKWNQIERYSDLPASIFSSLQTKWNQIERYSDLPASIFSSLQTKWVMLESYTPVLQPFLHNLNTSWRIFESYAVAGFTASHLWIALGEEIQFTDLSLNTPTAWLWDFGDGGTSAEQNPTHTYTAVGTYTVSLWVENEYGESTKVREGYIFVEGSKPLLRNITTGWKSVEGIILAPELLSLSTKWANTGGQTSAPEFFSLYTSWRDILIPIQKNKGNAIFYFGGF